MKLDARQAAALLRNPDACRFILLYGDDEGLIREHALTLTLHVAGSVNDPFLVVELMRDGWNRIAGEMASLSMIGGRRVIVVRDATDAALGPITQAMKGPGSALLVVEGAGLGKGKLRTFAEGDPHSAAIACYPEEGRALTDLIKTILGSFNAEADPEAIAWLGQTLGGNRAVVRSEIEKLALLAGAGGMLDLRTAQASTGDGAATASDDGLLAATLGDNVAADASLEAAIADGLNGVALMRTALMHLQKLHQAKLRMENGMTAVEAVRTIRPPVFYRSTASMVTALGRWSGDMLLRAIEEARHVEVACKQTGSRPELLAKRFVQDLARAAKSQRQDV